MGVDVRPKPPPVPNDDLSLDEVVQLAATLVPIPDVVHEVMRLARDENAGAHQVALVVGKDPTLSAAMLRLANSSAYRATEPISEVPKAVARLGISTVEKLVLSLAVAKKPARANALSETIRRLMVASAASARVVARYTDRAEPETLFLVGLLQDVGQMVLALAEPDDYACVFDRVSRQREDVMYVEQITYGFTHADLGERLAQQWNLPEVVTEGIRYHHDVVGAMSMGTPDASLNAAVTSMASDIGLALYGHRPREMVCAAGLAGHNGQAVLQLGSDVLDVLWDECREAAFELGAVFGL